MYIETNKKDVIVRVSSRPWSESNVYVEGAELGMILKGNVLSSPPEDSVDKRDRILSELVHDLGGGRVIQCRPHPFSDNSNMRNAIEQMERRGEESRGWYAADNTWITVTSKELKEAIESGQDQSDAVWSQFAADVTS